VRGLKSDDFAFVDGVDLRLLEQLGESPITREARTLFVEATLENRASDPSLRHETKITQNMGQI